MDRFVYSQQTALTVFVRLAVLLELVLVAVGSLDKTFTAGHTLIRPVLNMTHNMVPHIAESERSLAAQAADQNLILSASVWVDKHASIELGLDVVFQVLLGSTHVFI